MRELKKLRLNGGRFLLALLLLLSASALLTACNTTAGAGEDVSATGHAVTDTAQKVKQGL